MSEPKTMVYRGFLLMDDPYRGVRAYRNVSFWMGGIASYSATDFELLRGYIDDANDDGDYTEDERVKEFEFVPPAYPNYIMAKVRQHLGLEEDDTSRDKEINGMTHGSVLGHSLEWEGIIGYTGRLISWIEDIYGVTLSD